MDDGAVLSQQIQNIEYRHWSTSAIGGYCIFHVEVTIQITMLGSKSPPMQVVMNHFS